VRTFVAVKSWQTVRIINDYVTSLVHMQLPDGATDKLLTSQQIDALSRRLIAN